MRQIATLFVAASIFFLGIALFIKINTVGRVVPGPMPINWIKLTDTGLLFSIAVSLLVLTKNKQ